jgi:cytochrome b6-f complex iron-sulfur subunit
METMNRKEFLKNLGLSSATLMALYCMGNLTACSSKSDPQPAPPTGTTPTPPTSTTPTPPPASTKVDFTLDLNQNDYKNLKDNGEFIIKDGIIVARAKDGTFVALSAACTHEGTNVTLKDNLLNCSNHGSNFNLDGSVKNGPAATALKKYNIAFNATALTVRVFE